MHVSRRLAALIAGLAALFTAALVPTAAAGAAPGDDSPYRLVTGLAGGSGSTVGPDGALYVTEPVAGRLTRVDPSTGTQSTVTSALPRRVVDIGGAMDVAFLGHTPYVLTTLVASDVGGDAAAGLYRVDGPDDVTLVADIGAWSLEHPPATDFFIPTGVHYAMQTYRGGFLVTDGHHNRVLHVTRDGDIREVRAFDNVVPTGLDLRGGTVYVSLAGPVPHPPEDGRVVAFRARGSDVHDVVAGARLAVDVERGPGRTVYVLSQGVFSPGNPEGSPADPDTGVLLRSTRGGELEPVAEGLDRPTSMELLRSTAYVVTFDGEVWAVDLSRHRR